MSESKSNNRNRNGNRRRKNNRKGGRKPASKAEEKVPAAPAAAVAAPAAAEAESKYSPEQQQLRNLLTAIAGASSSEEAAATADAFATAIVASGLASIAEADVISVLRSELLEAKKKPFAREGGVLAVAALCERLGAPCVGALIDIIPTVLSLTSDKKSPAVRSAAETTSVAIFQLLPDPAVPVYIKRVLLEGKEAAFHAKARWQTKVAGLKILSAAAEKAASQVEGMMTTLVPVVSALMWDMKKQVKTQAADTLDDICGSINNEDIQPFIPDLVEAIADPKGVPECVYSLAGTTFVATVTASALSITVPILKRGFNDKKTAIKRKCAVITENMAKLVKNPSDVAPFMPTLEPLLALGIETISDPECRARFEKANEVLNQVSDKGDQVRRPEVSTEFATTKFTEALASAGASASSQSMVSFSADVAAALCNVSQCVEANIWKLTLGPLLAPAVGGVEAAEPIINSVREACAGEIGMGAGADQEDEEEEDEEDAAVPDLCDLRFSLAYGTKILLNNTRLHLKKGYKYGIIANKSAGKTTMMRAISNGQVEGFPTKEEVRTIFIENDIQGAQLQMNVVEYVLDTVALDGEEVTVTADEVRAMLTEIGFTDVMQNGPITSLSGGWKMKLALGRATLQRADIMLMDEPTNHLDVLNVQWVVDFINSQTNVTCLIVSHDTGFLDKTVDHIIHFDSLKLKMYRGNVSTFVERFPEARSYFELGSTPITFKFPQPTLLDGVRTKGTTIMSMTGVNFTYPGAEKPQLNNVSVVCSMASRVAVVGANGAGKSTMIKLLTGELKPTAGRVHKHPNCRFAYVAQHAFHHIEQHLDKSPNEYIRWRYEGGADKEARRKTTAIITEAEEKIMSKPFEVTWKDEETGALKKEKRVLEKLMSRRKVKKSYHYEVKWKGKTMDFNSWYPRETLEKRGFIKLIRALDTRMAAAQQVGKPLTARNVEEHLGNVGLDAEEATHSRIRDLSGGQKVKVVLAACTWMCPHLIILDEPTNYLDRDSLGALAKAIDSFEGGVILITHNKEFADATTKVTWVVANHRCDIRGDPEWEKYAAEQEIIQSQQEEELVDAAGNKISKKKIKTVEEMTKAEIRKNKKMIKNKIKNGEELEEHEMDWADEWNIAYEYAE